MGSKNLTIALLILIILAVLWTNGKMQRVIAALTASIPVGRQTIEGKAVSVS